MSYLFPNNSRCNNIGFSCGNVVDCLNRQWTRLANSQSNDLVNFCQASNVCINDQLQAYSEGQPTLLAYFDDATEYYLTTLTGYSSSSTLVLSTVAGTLQWTIGGGGGGSGTVTEIDGGNGMNFSSITTSGTVTMGVPSSVTLSSTNSLSTTSHTHAFVPGGTSSQIILGDGTLGTLSAGSVTSFTFTDANGFDGTVTNPTTTPTLTLTTTVPDTRVFISASGALSSSANLKYDTSAGLSVLIGLITMDATGSGTTRIRSWPGGGVSFGADAALNASTNINSTDWIAIGSQALYNQNANTRSNIAIGKVALASLTTGGSNVALGADTQTTTGSYNTLIGHEINMAGTTNTGNTGVGYRTQNAVTTGNYNSSLGRASLESMIDGQYNTAVGIYSLGQIQHGSGNVALGRGAGWSQTGTISSRLFINNSEANTNAMFVGDFSSVAHKVAINVPEGTSLTQTLLVNGNIASGIAGTTQGRLLLSGSTSGVITIQTAATAGTQTLTLPATLVAGGVLTDVAGNGVLSWTTPSAATTLYTGDGLLLGNRDVDLSDNTLIFENNGNNFLKLDPTAGSEQSYLLAYNTTGGNNISSFYATVSNTSTETEVTASFNGGAKVGGIDIQADTISSRLYLNATTVFINSTLGGTSTGYVWALQNTGTGEAAWAAPTMPISSLLAATAGHSIDNTNFGQSWSWSTLSTDVGLQLLSTSTAAVSNAQRILEVALSGTNSNSAQTTYAAKFSNIHTGTTSTNIAALFTATSGTNNFAIQLVDGTEGSGKILTSDSTGRASWATPSSGTVTSVSFTGGLISVATATTTPALTVAGTSGGIPYFSSTSTWASSALLAANALMIGGGAATAPFTTTTGTGILTFLGTPSSANLLAALTDETGTGVAVFGTAPTFTTSITDPLVIGGTAVSSTLTLKSTSGVGSSDAIIGVVGNNGATEAFRVNTTGEFLIGSATDKGASKLQVTGALHIYGDGANTMLRLAYTDGSIQTGEIYRDNSTGGMTISGNSSFLTLIGAGTGIDMYGSSGAHIRLRPQGGGGVTVGPAASTPSALLHPQAGSTTLAPFKFTTGTNLTTAAAGAMEFDGSNLYFTPTGTIRKTIATDIVSRAAAQTAAVATVVTQTVGAADASYIISANVLVTTSTVHSFTVTCAYTDEGNTARTITLTFSNLAGTMLTTIANAAGAVPYEGVPLHIRAKAATTITIATTGTFTTVTYNVEAGISQIN